MIAFTFLDSTIKLYSSTDLLYYYSERNCIISGISLFLLIVLRRLVLLLDDLHLEKKKVKVLEKQIYNQKDFVNQMIKDDDLMKKKIGEAETRIRELEEVVKKNEVLVKQARNNQEEYFKLLDKYNALRYSKESKKKI